METAEVKRLKKTKRFRMKEGKNETVVFVPATQGSELKKRYLKTIQKAKLKVAVVKVKRKVQRSDPFKSRECQDKEICIGLRYMVEMPRDRTLKQ